MPTVSAIIPTYNRAHLLPAALASIFAQTQPVDEVIVVDDGSKDNTADVLRTYGDRVRYIRQQNAGAGAARNHGMREARGDYVAFLDSDDLWMPEKNARQQELLRAHPEIDFLFGDMANFSSENDPIEAEIKDARQHA
ncbi:MAG TPA: glycosyltransferase family A protein, partial [Candidatus Didemnitutus sp.]|nr:glycosyltransferase family A protein [Candidatus Didemnitutus sp.]